MANIDKVCMGDCIPILPHDLASFTRVRIPWPWVIDIEPLLWFLSNNENVLLLPPNTGPGVTPDTALQGSVCVYLGFGLGPVGCTIESSVQAVVGEALITVHLTCVERSAIRRWSRRNSPHSCGNLILSIIVAMEVQDHLTCSHSTVPSVLLAIEDRALVRTIWTARRELEGS